MIWPTTNDDIIDTIVLVNEGGYVNNPSDKGGATNFGITQATLTTWRKHPTTIDDVRNMERSEAIAIYRERYITQPRFDQLVDMRLRTVAVDSGVLFGATTVVLALQGILGVAADGVLGPATGVALSNRDPRSVANALAVWRIRRHATRCVKDPSQLQFLNGWVNRACTFIE